MDDLRLAKAKLVKLTSSDNIETVVDEFLDIVKIFESHEITPDMIQPSKTGLALGPAVRNFIKKIKEGSEAHERGLQLLKAWKNIVTAVKVESSATASESKANEPKPPKLETASFSTSGAAPADLGPPVNIQEAAAITKPVQGVTTSSSSSSGGKNDISNRRAARKVLLTAFKEIPSVVAEKVVSSIESALDKAFFDKEYSSKYRSLAANLKKNKVRVDCELYTRRLLITDRWSSCRPTGFAAECGIRCHCTS